MKLPIQTAEILKKQNYPLSFILNCIDFLFLPHTLKGERKSITPPDKIRDRAGANN